MPQVDPQITRALLGGNFVPGIDPRQEEESWLNLQAKRQALQRQPRIDALQERNIESEIKNRDIDNQRASELQQAGIVAAAAARKKEEDALAKATREAQEAKDRTRHAAAAVGLYLDPKPEVLDTLKARGVLNDEEHAAFAQLPPDQWKTQARGLMVANMTPAEIENFDKEQSTIASQTATAAKTVADTKKIESETTGRMDAFKIWAKENNKPENALSLLQFDAAVKRDPEAGKSAAQKEFEYAKTQGFAGDFQAYQNLEANRHRSVTNVTNAGVPATPANANLTGDAYLKTLPAGIASRVRQIAEGRETLNARTPQDIRSAVAQFDPGFSEQRAQIRKAFTTGPDAKNIGALNTAMAHLDRLGTAAEAMGNGSFTPGNQAYNWLRDKFGKDTVTNFALLKNAVAGEMATALKGAATDQEITHMGETFRSANSPDQMAGAVAEGLAILNDKANTYNERYHSIPGMESDPWTPILPSARAAMARRAAPAATPAKDSKGRPPLSSYH